MDEELEEKLITQFLEVFARIAQALEDGNAAHAHSPEEMELAQRQTAVMERQADNAERHNLLHSQEHAKMD